MFKSFKPFKSVKSYRKAQHVAPLRRLSHTSSFEFEIFF